MFQVGLFDGSVKAFTHIQEPRGGSTIEVTISGGTRPMEKQLKQIECPAPCNFSVKSYDEKEIVEITVQHAKKIHDMTIAAEDVKKMIRLA
jgi:predicted small metal-binding protein